MKHTRLVTSVRIVVARDTTSTFSCIEVQEHISVERKRYDCDNDNSNNNGHFFIGF